MPKSIENKLKPLDTHVSIGKRIAKFRVMRGLTQEELAQKIGIKRVLISDYERGKIRIYGEMIARIAKALKVSADSLLGLNETYNNQIPSLKLMKRFYDIEKLSLSQQKTLLKTIDNFLKAEGIH